MPNFIRRAAGRPARDAIVGTAHIETFTSTKSGEPIYVSCVCTLSRNHGWEEEQQRAASAAREGGNPRTDAESGPEMQASRRQENGLMPELWILA